MTHMFTFHHFGGFLFRRPRLMLTMIAFLTVFAGCGYRPMADGGGDKTLTVYMPMWTNQTSELGLDAMIFQALADRAKRTGRVRLTTSPEAAAYKFSGTILSLVNPGLSYGTADQARELNAQLTVSFSLKENASNKPVMEEKGYTLADPYFLGSDAVRTRSNRRKALDKIAEDLAEEIIQRIMDLSP